MKTPLLQAAMTLKASGSKESATAKDFTKEELKRLKSATRQSLRAESETVTDVDSDVDDFEELAAEAANIVAEVSAMI